MKTHEEQQEGRVHKPRLFFSLDYLVEAKKLEFSQALKLHKMVTTDRDHEMYRLGVQLIYGVWREAALGGMHYRGPTRWCLLEYGIIDKNEEFLR